MAQDAPKGKIGTVGTVSLIAIGTFVATSGEDIVATLRAFWEWVLLVADKMPLGMGAFIAANILGCLLMSFLRHWIPEPKDKFWMHARIFLFEVSVSALAFMIVWIQERSVMNMVTAAICALLVPLSYRVYAAIGIAIMRRLRALA